MENMSTPAEDAMATVMKESAAAAVETAEDTTTENADADAIDIR